MNEIIDLTRYFPTDPMGDATPGLLRAIEDARGLEQPTLSFPKGVWHFWPHRAYEKHYFISNNDAGLKRVAIPLVGFERITIEGNGAELMIHGRMLPIAVDQCRNVVIRNLAIDAPVPFFGQGLITGAGEGFVELEIDKRRFAGSVEAGRLLFYTDEWEYEPTDELFIVEFNAQRNEPEYKTGSAVFKFRANTGDPYLTKGAPVVAASEHDGRIRLEGNITQRFTVGNNLYIGFEKRNNPGVFLTQSEGVTLEHLRIYHAGAMALIGQLTRDITIRGMHLAVREGSGRIVSAAGDATHFVNCSGELLMEDCIFEHMMDDGTNIHGIYTTVCDILDDRTLDVEFMHYQQWGVPLYQPGDVLCFINREDLSVKGQATVTAVNIVNCQHTQLQFDRDISGIAAIHDAVENPGKMPRATLRRIRSGNNRSRGFLLNTPLETLVEQCVFHNSGDGVSLNGDANYWFESGPVAHVVLRDNHFLDGGYGYGGTAISLNPELDTKKTRAPYHRNVLIENNRFDCITSGVLRAKSCSGLVFRNNQMKRSTRYPFWDLGRPGVIIEDCPDAIVEPLRED